MATTPQRPPSPPPPPQHTEPPRHPAEPPAVKPGVPQPDQQPQPEPKDKKPPEEKVLSPEEAKQLFHAGHRLKKKGDPPGKWIAASRIAGKLVLCVPVDEEVEKNVLGQQLVLVADEQISQP